MAVLLVRHAEDRAAAERRFGDEGLTAKGIGQARALARSFAGVSLRGCWVSPLARARQTAEIVLEGRELPVEISPSLAEGAVGELDGLSFDEGARRYPRDFQRGRTVVARLLAMGRTAPGGESRAAFLGRAVEVAGLRSDGAALPLELTVEGVGNDQKLFTVIARDISARKAAERDQQDHADMMVEALRREKQGAADLAAAMDWILRDE